MTPMDFLGSRRKQIIILFSSISRDHGGGSSVYVKFFKNLNFKALAASLC